MATQERASVVWGGDVVLARRQHYLLQKIGIDRVLDLETLRTADVAIVNLECVVATSGEQGIDKGEGGPFYYRARPEMLKILPAAGIRVVATANNHSGDYGPSALLEQLDLLERTGLLQAGTGANRAEAFAPVVFRAGNFNVALFSVDVTQASFAATDTRPGTAYLPLKSPELWRDIFQQSIAAIRRRVHIVLVAVHWGQNYVHAPVEAARVVGRILIDAGADAVLGSSAHVLHGVEIYKERPIIYDAGNLLFDALTNKPDDCGLFQLEVSADGVTSLKFIPVAGHSGYSEEREGEDAQAACARFAKKCLDLGTNLTAEPDGRLSIGLSPSHRPSTPKDLVPLNVPSLEAIPAASEVGDLWCVSTIPVEASCEPVLIGPLMLVGLRVWPKAIKDRRMLWIESFWRTDQALEEDIRIEFQAVPVRPARMKPWGERTDHDPCDWLHPTSRWLPGRIYRDFYGLRPAYLKDWENVDLQVVINLVSNEQRFGHFETGQIVRLEVPEEVLRKFAPKGSYDKMQSTNGWSAKALQDSTGGAWVVSPPTGWSAQCFNFSSDLRFDTKPLFVAYDAAERAKHENSNSLKAQKWDRHDQLKRIAAQGGHCGAIAARTIGGMPPDFPVLVVKDPLKAVMELGVLARDRFSGPVIAVTGTAGKSSTGTMLSTMMGPGQTLCTVGNYNTRVGTLLTLANLNAKHKAAVIEVAQSALWMKTGPITRSIRPTVSVITSIGFSQTNNDGIKSTADVAKWKSRVFDGLVSSKIAVFPDFVDRLDLIKEMAAQHASRSVVFGYGEAAEVRILSISPQPSGSRVDLRLPLGDFQFFVPVYSRGMAENAVAAMSVLYAMGHDLGEAALRLCDLPQEDGRMQLREIILADGRRIEVIDDSWNAEVSSMVNALDFAGERVPGPGGRRIGVLGRIVHLGSMAPQLHESLATPVIRNNFDLVLTHGAEMLYLREKLPQVMLGPHFSDAETLVEYLVSVLFPGDLVLIKGSRRDSDFGSIPGLLGAGC